MQEEKEEVNTAQDFTKPLTRLDIRQKYQWLAEDKYAAYTTLRADNPILLKNRWIFTTRFDVPVIVT